MRNTQRSTVRVQRPRSPWRDPRMIIGLLLVTASILGVWGLVSTARSGQMVYQATRDIAPGEPLSNENIALVDARPGSDVYLTGEEEMSDLFTTHALHAGELIARSAATTKLDQSMRTFVITVDESLPDGVTPGDMVELWFIPDSAIGQTTTPEARKVGEPVYVVRVVGEKSGIGVTGGTRLELRSTADQMGTILSSTHANGHLVAVPVGTR